jgi:hypothetical protein
MRNLLPILNTSTKAKLPFHMHLLDNALLVSGHPPADRQDSGHQSEIKALICLRARIVEDPIQ